ncbi:MAG: hypothetical protein QGF46_02255, partial [Planctomycetota bacterium]|nr:hypothetical protein [Planctomycetota bacterium]
MSPRLKSNSKSQKKIEFGDTWPYSPAPDSTPVEIADKSQLFINGEFKAPQSRKYFDSINPANEQVLSKIPLANSVDV